jgi:hypothetical protein
MMTSKSSGPGDGDRSWANIVHTIVRNPPSQKNLRFITSLEVIERRFPRKKGMQGAAAFDVAKFTKRRGNAHALRKSPRNVNYVFNAFCTKRLGVRCALAPLCAMPPATAKRATRRDSYYEACCLRIGQANRSRPRNKAQLRLTPKGFRIEGKSEFNERGTSDEDDNKIQIHAPQSSILAVGFLRRRHCNFHRRMRGRSLRNSV